MRYFEMFRRHFASWVEDACREYGYDQPARPFYESVTKRLTESTLAWIGYGLENSIVLEDGLRFNLARNASHKGPYKWFSRRSDVRVPQVNWEYFVQVAYLVRIWESCTRGKVRPVFEDELLDLAVRKEGELLWCIEVKERAEQLKKLLAKLEAHAEGVDLDAPDRRNDALRKAKYLVKHHPSHFSAVANGLEKHFQVSYPGPISFSLVDADPPLAVRSTLENG